VKLRAIVRFLVESAGFWAAMAPGVVPESTGMSAPETHLALPLASDTTRS